MSKSDQRKGFRGTRSWFWAKDTKADNRNDERTTDDIEWICDVDYYIDMPTKLATNVRPYLIYTVVPEAACSSGQDDTSFCFDECGNLTTFVAGGGQYTHPLWNYGYDSLKVVLRSFGFPYKTVFYSVERKQIGTHRQLIALVPLKQFNGVWAVLANALVWGNELKRFNPIVKTADGSKFVRFNIVRRGKLYTTTARVGSMLCATAPAEADAAIDTIARLGSTKLMLPSAATWLKGNREQAAVLTDYYRVKSYENQPFVFPVDQGVRAYNYDVQNFDQDEKPKLQAFMSPLIHGAFAPVQNLEAEKQCILERVERLKKSEPLPHSFRDRCIKEFAELVTDGCVLSPVSFETIAAKQIGPAQKLSIAKAIVHGSWIARIVNNFIKSEAYPDVKDPRNITVFNDLVKLDMSHFTLSLSDHCKQFKWYGPGMTPLEIANRVVEVCVDAKFVNISDYHRMDGTITETLRQVDRAVFMKAFKHHRAELNQLLKHSYNNVGYLPRGTSYNQGTSQGSGNPDTSVAQTLRAAFTAYLAFRNYKSPEGRGFDPKEAFERIGLHLGDDGIDAELPTPNHLWAANRVGLILEANTVARGKRGVNFLARYYSPEVWFGSPNSMCDIKRQLSKFHTTVRLPDNVKATDKLVEKSLSYLATDRNTPVIGQLCQQVYLLCPTRPRVLHGIGYWWGKFDQSAQYPNDNVDGWMDVEFGHQLPEFDRSLFSRWLAETKELSGLLQAPICTPIRNATPTSVDVVVDGTILDATPVKEEAPKPRKARQDVPKKRTRARDKRRSASLSPNRTRRAKGPTPRVA